MILNRPSRLHASATPNVAAFLQGSRNTGIAGGLNLPSSSVPAGPILDRTPGAVLERETAARRNATEQSIATVAALSRRYRGHVVAMPSKVPPLVPAELWRELDTGAPVGGVPGSGNRIGLPAATPRPAGIGSAERASNELSKQAAAVVDGTDSDAARASSSKADKVVLVLALAGIAAWIWG